MVSVYNLKPKFQQLLAPFLTFLAERGFTPNAVTLLALIGSVIVGIIIRQTGQRLTMLVIMPIWLVVRMALNAIDGMMARNYNLGTPIGRILNELGDVLSDLALYLPLGFIIPESLGAITVFCFGAILTEFCGVMGYALNVSRHYEGPMGKSDRAFLIGVLSLATVFRTDLQLYWPWIIGLAAVLTAWTCFNRIRGILSERSEAPKW
jgi:CDP-diacylglycerol--glycerol-3-phosphate 3-phosphatidyltransferase